MQLLKFITSLGLLHNSYMEKKKKKKSFAKNTWYFPQCENSPLKENIFSFAGLPVVFERILILHPCMLLLQEFLFLWRWFWAASPEWPEINPVIKLQVTLSFYLQHTETMVSIIRLFCFSVFDKNGNLGEHRIYFSGNVLVCIFSKHHHPHASFCLSRFQPLPFLLWFTHLQL